MSFKVTIGKKSWYEGQEKSDFDLNNKQKKLEIRQIIHCNYISDVISTLCLDMGRNRRDCPRLILTLLDETNK